MKRGAYLQPRRRWTLSLRDSPICSSSSNGAGRSDSCRFHPDRKAIDIGDFYADFSRIRRELGWEPQVSLREGLSKSLAFSRAQRRSTGDRPVRRSRAAHRGSAHRA